MKVMKGFQVLSFFWVAACLLAGCNGTLLQTMDLAAVKHESSGNHATVSARSPEAVHTPELFSASSPDTASLPDLSSLQNLAVTETEIFGTVEAVTIDAITVNGVTYSLIPPEVHDTLLVGDQIRVQLTINTDGTLSIRRIERMQNISHRSGNSHDDLEPHVPDDHENHHPGGSCGGGCSDH